MTSTSRLKSFLIISPILVLIITRIGIEFSVRYFRHEIAWIPSFIAYYFAITLMFFIASKYFSLPFRQNLSFSIKPLPKFGLLFWAIIIPALLPLAVFIPNIKFVPVDFIFYIIIFSFINPIFEEGFWRGLLYFIPINNKLRILYTAGLFSFSHFFFWGYWFNDLLVLIPTLISTFIMGVLWMWFMQKQKNLIYPIISHFFVDFFNLSVAVYFGLVPKHF